MDVSLNEEHRMYLDGLQITFRVNNQVQIININPENLNGFTAAHPDYEFISIIPVQWRMLR